MRLHRLTVRAWGPFPGQHEIDFAALGQSGLFLVHGATGSGKTSVLDAICFALYADVPGARSRSLLRSDHAVSGAVPAVELDFTAGGRRFRVQRSPEFTRAKRRGEGCTRVPARVVLEEHVDGEWVCRGSRLDEVALVVKDVLGMDLEQFVTVVLLPQGQCAAFLSAAPDRRREVLEQLFQTRRFTRVEQWLAERRREVSVRLALARQALSTALVRVDDVLATVDGVLPLDTRPVVDAWPAGAPGGAAADAASGDAGAAHHGGAGPRWGEPVESIPAELARLGDRLCEQATEALTAAEVATLRAGSTERDLYAGRATQHSRHVGSGAQAELAAVAAGRPQADQDRRRLARAERATSVSGFVEAARHAGYRVDRAAAAAAGARALLTGDPATVDTDGLGELLRTVVAASALVEQARAASTGVGHELRLAAEHAAEGDTLLAQASSLHEQCTSTQQRLHAAIGRRDADLLVAGQLPERVARRRELGRGLALMQQIHAAQADAVARKAGVSDLRERSVAAREELVGLQERRLAGMAAELAASLQDGQACCVCGSTVHPAPAVSSDPVTTDQIEAARLAADRAAAGLQTAERNLAQRLATAGAHAEQLLALDLHTLHVDVADLAGIAELATDWGPLLADAQTQLAQAELACRQAETAQASAEAAAPRVAALSGELAELADEVDRCRAGAARAEAVQSEARRRAELGLVSARSSIERHGGRCPCPTLASVGGAGPAGTADDIARQHERARSLIETSLAAERDREREQEQLSAAVQRRDAALIHEGFATVAEVEAASLSPDRVADLTGQLDELDQRRIRAETLLSQPEVRAALASPEPDLDLLDAEHRASTAALDRARARHTLLEHAGRQLRALQAPVDDAVLSLGPATAEWTLVQQVADCVAGTGADNAMRMRLSSYVLAARLEEVVALANERLSRLSDGRFTLRHSDERAARGARGGLGLRVLDGWTGALRQTGSLSGGETFMASLALALALGDAVRAEAGGFDLQTLFVDEGFGSLDEESLEQVLSVLDGLRSGGRTVGIVSHVAELRTRIPAQLHVRKTPEGSTLAVLTDAASGSAA